MTQTITELATNIIVNANSTMRTELAEYGLDISGEGTTTYETAKQMHIDARRIIYQVGMTGEDI